MEEKQQDENGIHGHCIAYFHGLCMLRIGPRECYNGGDYNTCPIRQTQKNCIVYNETVKKQLTVVIKRKLRKNSSHSDDVSKISDEIMKKFVVRIKNNGD